MLNKLAKVVEIFYLIIAGICLIETIVNFSSGNSKLGFIFLAGVAFGLSMYYSRKKMRLKMNNEKNIDK